MGKRSGLKNQGRRDFFTKIVMASLASGLPPMVLGCGDGSEYKGTGLAPYKVWEELLYYLQTSPDYLEGRMKMLIQEGDPEAMFNFVRDEIYLIPQYTKSIGYGDGFKWGLQYALRSGMATMREKAELLHQMYLSAGIPSSIKNERTDISPEEAQTFFFRPKERIFAPEVSRRTLRRWIKEMELSDLDYVQALINKEDNQEKEALNLAERIWSTLELPADYYVRMFDFRWPNYSTPTVEFEWENQTRHAHLFDTKVPFGELRSGVATNLVQASEIRPNKERVLVTLSYRDSITPNEEKELVRGDWLASDLVGRQLNLGFLNNLTLEEQAIMAVGNIRTFTPVLALQALGESPEYMAERSILANPITLTGKRIKLDNENGGYQIGDAVLLDKPKPNLHKLVKSLQVNATTTGYPGVKLSITPADENGRSIEGLGARDFIITEDENVVNGMMEANQVTPRILIMADGSGSMPSEYRGKGMDEFIANLKSKILEKYPAAVVTFWLTPSALYSWLLKASQTENDLIIFATDGHNNDEFDPQNEPIYKSGPPAIVLNVYNTTYQGWVESFEKMAELTGGLHLPAADQQAAMIGIAKYLEGIEIQPYAFTYNSVGRAGERTVKVTMDKNRISGTTTYVANPTEAPSHIGPRIIGLYLTVQYSTQYAVKRVLAGWDRTVKPYEEPSRQMADDVHDLILGGMKLYFEGAGPTYSAALSDLLKVKLSSRKWGEALIKNTLEDAKKAYMDGHHSISGDILTLMAPLSAPASNTTLTVPGGLRIGLETIKPGITTGTTHVLFDYFPTSEYITLGNEPMTAFRTTLQKTAELAVREKMFFAKSTLEDLADKNWICLARARQENWFSGKYDTNERYWSTRAQRGGQLRVYDKTATSRAFWDIDGSTGELQGILPNGSGGGGNNANNDIEAYNRLTSSLLQIVSIIHDQLPKGIGGLNSIGAFSLGVVAKYGETLIKLYAIATEAIMVMDASFVDEQVRKALAQFACQVAEDIVSAGTGTTMVTDGLEELIGMIAPENYQNPFTCN